jgi:copper chaperone CopZ
MPDRATIGRSTENSDTPMGYSHRIEKRDIMSIQTFTVSGMTCGHCVQAVTSELAKLPGVTDVTVDLTSGVATVESGRTLDSTEVAAAVDEAGYELAP